MSLDLGTRTAIFVSSSVNEVPARNKSDEAHHELIDRIQNCIIPLSEPFRLEIGNRNVAGTLLSRSDAIHKDTKHLYREDS